MTIKPIGICPDCKGEISAIGSQLRVGRSRVEIFCLKCAAKRISKMALVKEKEGKNDNKGKVKGGAKKKETTAKKGCVDVRLPRTSEAESSNRKGKVVHKRLPSGRTGAKRVRRGSSSAK